MTLNSNYFAFWCLALNKRLNLCAFVLEVFWRYNLFLHNLGWYIWHSICISCEWVYHLAVLSRRLREMIWHRIIIPYCWNLIIVSIWLVLRVVIPLIYVLKVWKVLIWMLSEWVTLSHHVRIALLWRILAMHHDHILYISCRHYLLLFNTIFEIEHWFRRPTFGSWLFLKVLLLMILGRFVTYNSIAASWLLILPLRDVLNKTFISWIFIHIGLISLIDVLSCHWCLLDCILL